TCRTRQRYRVGDDQFVQTRPADVVDGLAGKYRVCHIGAHTAGTVVLERAGGLAQCTGGVDDIIHHDAALTCDIADDVHDPGFIGLRTALVDDGQIRIIKTLGQRPGTHHAAYV